jgi:LPS sulfotransferase NodH
MTISLKDLNKKRKDGYQKNNDLENFFLEMNKSLQSLEKTQYQNYDINHPFIFIIGLPRSGTTLMSQVLAHSLDTGYINNLISRFWLAPLHGIRLSNSVIGNSKKSDFYSDYARTFNITDIHEFGYFWRYWLKKETFDDVTFVKEREKNIEWDELLKVLSTMQHEFGKPMVFKNIFGSYHMVKFRELLQKVIYVHIERDQLDVAISILEARKKYYEDLNTWWSYQPIEYEKIKNLDYWHQIAGQIYYLKSFYQKQAKECGDKYVINVKYESLCTNPSQVINIISNRIKDLFSYNLEIINPISQPFPYRVYSDRKEEKEKFDKLINDFSKKHGE